MTDRRFTVPAFAVAALTLLLLPAAASAQSIWDVLRDRARDRSERDEDYRRRRDDDYGRRRDGRINDYERRVLRDVARRLEDRSRSFQRNLDRVLDHSRHDDTRREDNINDTARDFRNAAARFQNEAGDSRDLDRSRDEARLLLQSASRVERSLRRVRLDSRASNDWSQIRADLRTVADIYGLRLRDYDGDDGDDRGGRRDDDYGRGRGRNRGGYPW
jgi:predicted ribosome quality control (RQC) complex YloA/Tae2 family protein